MFVFLLTTLNTYFIRPFSVAVWFKQSKHTTNVNYNGHQNKKTPKNVLKQKNTAQ